MKKHNNTKILAILFVLFIAFLVFWPWFQPGFLSNGDWWHILPSRAREYFNNLLIWDAARALGSPLSNSTAHYGIHYIYGLLQEYFSISTSVTARIFWFIPFIVFSLISGWQLGKYFTKRIIGSVIGAIIFTFNTFALTTIAGGQMTIAVSYAIAPLSVITFLRLVETKQKKYAYGLALLVAVQAIYDVRMLAIAVFSGFFLAFIDWYLASKKVSKQVCWPKIKLILLAFVFFLLLSSYWVIPLLFGSGGVAGVPSSHTNVGWVSALSYSNMANTLAANHVWWPFSDGELNPIQPLFYFITILAIAAILTWKKNKRIIGLSLLMLLGFFLTKGTNEPINTIYEWMFINVPGFIMFRDPAKFYLMIMLALAPLASIGAVSIIDQVNFRWRKITTISILILILLPLYPAFTNQLKGTFIPKSIPAEYTKFANFYMGKPWGRTLWVPAVHRYAPYTQQNGGLNAREMTSDQWSFFLDETGTVESFLTHPYAQKIINNSGIRWVGLPYDTENEIYRHYEPFEFYENILNNTSWLKRVDSGVEQIAIYENEQAKPEIYSASSVVAIDKEALREAPLDNLSEEDLLLLTSRYEGVSKQYSSRERSRIVSLDKQEYKITDDSISWEFALSEDFTGKLIIDEGVASVPINIDDRLVNLSGEKNNEVSSITLERGKHTLKAVFGQKENIFYQDSFSDVSWGVCQDQRGRLIAPDNFYLAEENNGRFNTLNLYSTEESAGCASVGLDLLEPGVYRITIDNQVTGQEGLDVKVIHDNGQSTTKYFEPIAEWNSDYMIFEIEEKLPSALLLLAHTVTDKNDEQIITQIGISDIKIEKLIDDLASWVKIEPDEAVLGTAQNITQFERVAPGKYKATLPAAENPYFIILNQAYNTGWQMKGLETTEHIHANGGLNAWLVDVDSDVEVTIEYGDSKPFVYGLIISLVTLIITIAKLRRKNE